jgi:hypothetical protein
MWFRNGIISFPNTDHKIPIAEENFLSCPKHALRENAIVSNERFKTIVMYSGQIKRRIATITSANTT